MENKFFMLIESVNAIARHLGVEDDDDEGSSGSGEEEQKENQS